MCCGVGRDNASVRVTCTTPNLNSDCVYRPCTTPNLNSMRPRACGGCVGASVCKGKRCDVVCVCAVFVCFLVMVFTNEFAAVIKLRVPSNGSPSDSERGLSRVTDGVLCRGGSPIDCDLCVTMCWCLMDIYTWGGLKGIMLVKYI
jgi:hypothetical protein